ncbi:hypothetical protein [Vibrio sagamiensis]|uniref:hypothetical protein n=1 Tax=Vibrio sagamiensis TaxID=512650 RepID=UPI00039A9A8A|nr:hypothetical protein [Vibrio sagamiensis]
MRPTSVRFAHTNRSATRRRSGFTVAAKVKQVAPTITLVEKNTLVPSLSHKVTQAA